MTIQHLVLTACLASAPPLQSQAGEPRPSRDSDGTEVRAHFQLGVNAISERNLFWNFAETVAPDSGFDPDADWLELYVKPGLSFETTTGDGSVSYGKLSFVGSYTLETDAYDFGDVGDVTLEEAYLGYRTSAANGTAIDVSLGARELKLGSGMLIASGGSSGFERGALKFGPRKAWELAAIGRMSMGSFTATLFYIDPNERPANDGSNELAGFDLRRDDSAGGYLGVSYVNVLESETPYIAAAAGGVGAPTILPGAREGTSALNAYARVRPRDGGFKDWSFAMDLAYEWNDGIDLEAWAWRIQAAYTVTTVPGSPTLEYTFQAFAGDDPDTPGLERFDPLYYEGSPSAWATGSKSSMVFINSNVRAHGLALRLSPGGKYNVTLRYAHIRASELRSPIQFGQATRVDTSGGTANVISGVTDAHLSDDLFLEYSRVITPNVFLTAGISVSLPGAGIDDTIIGDVPRWTGGFVNVVFNY